MILSSRANWLQNAMDQPVAFAQVREDPSLDLSLLQRLGNGIDAVIIASGGCTAAALVASERLKSLRLVDANPAQIALTKVKLSMLRDLDTDGRMKLLGHLGQPAEERRSSGLELLAEWNLPADIFGDTQVWSSLGLDHCGRYEMLFAELRARLGGDAEDLALRSKAFASTMSQANLQALFGDGATANRVTDFWRHFHLQTSRALEVDPDMGGPFLSQMLRGQFKRRRYRWLDSRSPTQWPEVSWCNRPMVDALNTLEANSCDLLHLSNILDWLSVQDATRTLSEASRVLRPGGFVIVRQLNSTLPIRKLGEHIDWQDSLSKKMLAADQSFFYRELHIGKKTR